MMPTTRAPFAALALFLLSTVAFAGEPLRAAKPADVGISATKLKAAKQLYVEAIARDDLKGAVLFVARNGKVVLHEALGWRNQAKKRPMQQDTLFRMASNTKAVIATAVMMLAEEGKVSIDDPLGKHLPAFDNEKCRGIRIKHLLNHTSGLRIKTLFLSPLMKRSKKHPDAPTLQLEVNRFAAIGPEKTPGTTFSYNNPGYNTLAALVEVVSKQPLEKFLTKRIYQPLGMVDTTNHPVKAKFSRMSVVYAKGKKTGKWSIRFRQNSGMRVPFIRGSGGMVSTAIDYAKFCQMFLNKGTSGQLRFLSKQSVAAMTRPQTMHVYTEKTRKSRTRFYGYGWTAYRDGSFSHGGSEGTYAWMNPKRGLIILILTQSPGGKNPRNEFIKQVVAACDAD